MKQIPILYSIPMVQAILNGSKTETRRLNGLDYFNQEPNKWRYDEQQNLYDDPRIHHFEGVDENNEPTEKYRHLNCPYGQPGDVLYVRESFYAYGQWIKNGKSKTGKQKWKFKDLTGEDFHYKYMDSPPTRIQKGRSANIGWYKRNSIHMPKAAARIWLQVVEIKAERLQSITEQGAIAEGVVYEPTMSMDGQPCGAIIAYYSLWTSLNGGESLDANPWVWVVKFKVLSTTGKPENII